MSTDQLFAIAFPVAVPFWVLLLAALWWRPARRVIESPWIAVPPLAVYVVVLIPQLGGYWSVMTNPSLPALAAILGTPAGATLIWAHLIGFDLLVGRWMTLDAVQRRVPGIVVAPLLLLTVLLAPVGFLAYLLLRSFFGSRPTQPSASRRTPAAPGSDAPRSPAIEPAHQVRPSGTPGHR